MDVNNKKRKGEDLEHDHQKKQRVSENTNDFNYLESLPLEILLELAKEVGSYSVVLLSLTCKHFYDSFSTDNKFWFSLFCNERLVNRTAVDLDNSSLREDLEDLEDEDYVFDRYDDELTTDTAQIQRELISDDYRPKYLKGNELIAQGQEDKPIKYDEQINYKELAVEEWLKRQHFELWSDTACASLYQSTCNCRAEETDLVLYDDNGNELSVDYSDNELVVLDGPADSTVESLSDDEPDEEMSAASCDSEASDEEIEPVMLTAELRDKIIASVADSPQLKIFVQVLDAAVLGHIPPSTCPDTERLAITKLYHKVVHLGNVVEEVIAQISRAVNLDAQACHMMLFCALQKLCLTDLLYLDQAVKARFPYFANVFSVHNIERSVPASWHDLVACNEPHWAFSFHASMASNDELDSMPDWLSLRHSIHRLMRCWVLNATPSATEHAISELVAFIRSTLQSIIELKGSSDAQSIEVSEVDVLKAVCRHPKTADFVQPHTMYLTSKLMQESMVQLRSDSECSYASSYSDASEEEEDLNQFVEENKTNILHGGQSLALANNENKDEDSIEEDLNNYQDLTEQIKRSVQGVEDDTSPLLMRTAVVYGQTDLTAEQLNDLSDEAFSDSDEQVEEQLAAWLAVDDDIYNPDYVEKMIHTLKQDAAYYAGNGEAGDRAEDEMGAIDSKVPDDLPELRQDLSEAHRAKILDVRRETNRLLKAEIMREHSEFLMKKYDRLYDNYIEHGGVLDPLQSKSLEIKFFSDNDKNIKRAVNEAIELIGKIESLKTIKIYDHHAKNIEDVPDAVLNEQSTPIQSLFDAIQNSASIDTIKLYSCHFLDLVPLIKLLSCKKLERFHFVFTDSFELSPVQLAPFLDELSKHSSLKELAIDYPVVRRANFHIQEALLSLLPSLQVLKLVLPFGSADQATLEHLETLMPKCNSLQRVVLCFNRFDLFKQPTEYFTQMCHNITEAAKPAAVLFTISLNC